MQKTGKGTGQAVSSAIVPSIPQTKSLQATSLSLIKEPAGLFGCRKSVQKSVGKASVNQLIPNLRVWVTDVGQKPVQLLISVGGVFWVSLSWRWFFMSLSFLKILFFRK